MSANVSKVRNELNEYMEYLWDGFVPEVETSNTVQIVMLRRTKSYNIFTTEGQELNISNTSMTIDGDENVDRVVMFKRKQVASERRTGKKILRSLGLIPTSESDEDKHPMSGGVACRLHDNLCRECIDCKLYGFAAAGANSRGSRVMTDSAFTLRDIEVVRENLTLNAQSEEHESASSTALSSRSHTVPETYLPTVTTLKDVSWRELAWVIHLLKKTTRYGAETSRTGYMRNHILLIRFGIDEPLSNLELTQMTTGLLDDDTEENVVYDPNLHSQDILKRTKQAAKTLIGKYGTGGTVMQGEDLDCFLDSVEELASDEKVLKDFLQDLHKDQKEHERGE